MEQPSPFASFQAASDAFRRTHVSKLTAGPKVSAKQRKRIELGVEKEPPTSVTVWEPKSSMTKFKALVTDLADLQQLDPDFRVIVFTRHATVQERLVQLITGEIRVGGMLPPLEDGAKLRVYEFSQATAPPRRHKIIKEFQDGASKGARCLVVTYATAAVGITLTAANRIFLMEPCVDPGQEVQACGRIHRLGQEKDCFVKRFAFRDSIEEAVVNLHEKIKAKEITVVDGKVDEKASKEALDAFLKGKTTHEHTGAQRQRKADKAASAEDVDSKEIHPDPHARYTTLLQPGETTSRKEQWRANAKEYEKDNGWGCECTQGACLFCGLYADLPGTFTWHGRGYFEYLNGDTRDPPPDKCYYNYYHVRRFRDVPRPPDGWKGLPLEKTNNGGELPKDAQATGSSVDGCRLFC